MVSLGPRKMTYKHRILRCSPNLCDFTATSSARHHSARIVAGQPWPPPLRSAPLAWWGCHHPTCGSEHPQKKEVDVGNPIINNPWQHYFYGWSSKHPQIVGWLLGGPHYSTPWIILSSLFFLKPSNISNTSCAAPEMALYTPRMKGIKFWISLPCSCAAAGSVPTLGHHWWVITRSTNPLNTSKYWDTILLPVVPHKAVAEVSKIGNL